MEAEGYRILVQLALRRTVGTTVLLILLAGCSSPLTAPPSVSLAHDLTAPTASATIPSASLVRSTSEPSERQRAADGLSDQEIATLRSLQQVDDHPLYIMHYHGAYEGEPSSAEGRGPRLGAELVSPRLTNRAIEWACSLFAVFGDANSMLYHGLVIGTAAVPPGQMREDPRKETLGSLMVMRGVLDRARNVMVGGVRNEHRWREHRCVASVWEHAFVCLELAANRCSASVRRNLTSTVDRGAGA